MSPTESSASVVRAESASAAFRNISSVTRAASVAYTAMPTAG